MHIVAHTVQGNAGRWPMISWGASCTRWGSSVNKETSATTPMTEEHTMYPEEDRKESESRHKVNHIQICHKRSDSRDIKRENT